MFNTQNDGGKVADDYYRDYESNPQPQEKTTTAQYPKFVPNNLQTITIRQARREFGRAAVDIAKNEPICVCRCGIVWHWLVCGGSEKTNHYYLLHSHDVSSFRDDTTLRPYTNGNKVVDKKIKHGGKNGTV